MTAEYVLLGMLCGFIGARVEMWKVGPRGGGLLVSLLVSQIGIYSHIGIRRLILIGVACAVVAELIHRYRYYRLHRCVWCGRLIWPWQNWIFARIGDVQGHYHNTRRLSCFIKGSEVSRRGPRL